MANSVSFINPYEEYSTTSAKTVLSGNDTISDEFKNKVKCFLNEKMEKLAEMQKEIFYDSSVYTGSAGVALFYYVCATRCPQPNHDMLLKSIESLNLDHLKGKRISFLCGDAGPLAIATVLSFKFGTRRPDTLPDYKSIAKRLIDLGYLLDESPDELLYGRSGYLYALLFVNKQIGKEVIPADYIEKVIQVILRSGKQLAIKMKSESPLLWQWHDKVYIGGAHGVAGILYVLLQAKQYVSNLELRNLVKPTLSWVLSLQYPSGNFPSSLGSSSGDRLVQWCHGAPGFVPLCLLAHQVFDDGRFMKVAVQCGEVVWKRGLSTKGYSLCHGVAGNAYAFIQLYQATKEPKHLYRACCFMEWCALQRPGSELRAPDRPASLFEGLIGRMYLADEMLHVNCASFPAYTV